MKAASPFYGQEILFYEHESLFYEHLLNTYEHMTPFYEQTALLLAVPYMKHFV